MDAAAPHGAGDRSVHDRFPADGAARVHAEVTITRIAREDPAWHRGVSVLRQLAGEATEPDPPLARSAPPAACWEQTAAEAIAAGDFVPAEVQDIGEHLRLSKGARHPRSADALDEAAGPPSLRAAVARLARWRGAAEAKRRRVRTLLHGLAGDLQPLTDRLYEVFAPDHIRRAGVRLHAAWLGCVAEAFDLDERCLVDCVLGFVPVGPSPASGAFPELEEPLFGKGPPAARRFAGTPFAELDHAAWCDELVASVEERWAQARVRGSADDVEALQTVWDATRAECAAGLMAGPFSADDLDRAYGKGAWRASRRFPVWQKGKCRPCDDCAESGHNVSSSMAEALECDSPDFPAVAAALFAQQAAGLGDPILLLRGGTDDIAAAYRMVPSAYPQFTVVCLADPDSGKARFFTMRGLNFGLASAPTLFGRVPRLATQLLRRVLAVVVTSFYDDFCVCEPAFAGASGQEAFWDTMELFGLPLAVEKHVPPAERFIFLGVQADFAGLQRTGVMTLGVTPERQDDVADAMEFFLDTGFLSTAEAARLCGRMVFVSMWSAGRWGRAPLRPILDVASRAAPGGRISSAVRGALEFFVQALRRGIDPRELTLVNPPSGPAIRVYTDAMYEDGVPSGLGIVVFVPPRNGQPERVLHASDAVPASFLNRFFAPGKRQYIGQLELLAAIAAYSTFPEVLAGEQVIHFVDNTSAVAALVKGYSRAPDSVTLVHLFAALRLHLRMDVWVQWVPSKANIADLPSRGEFAMLRGMGSVSRAMVFPDLSPFGQVGWAQAPLRRPPRVLGSVAVGHVRVARPREGDVVVMRGRSPLGNPYPVGAGASRSRVVAAMRRVLAGESVAAVATPGGAPHLRFVPALASERADSERRRAIDELAERVAGGRPVRLLCACFPKLCHASVVAARVRARATEMVEARRARKRPRRLF